MKPPPLRFWSGPPTGVASGNALRGWSRYRRALRCKGTTKNPGAILLEKNIALSMPGTCSGLPKIQGPFIWENSSTIGIPGRNKARKSRYKNAIKKMNILIEGKKKSEALKFLPKLNSELMKIAKTGIIKKQNASRNVSRITKKITTL